MDSATSSATLSSSWGSFGPSSPKGFLYRQSSLPVSSVSAPVSIPGRAACASIDGADAGATLCRRSLTLPAANAYAPFSAGAGLGAPGTSPPGFGGAAPAAAAAGPGAAAPEPRLPMLVRSLSRGLSASLDFR